MQILYLYIFFKSNFLAGSSHSLPEDRRLNYYIISTLFIIILLYAPHNSILEPLYNR